MNARWRKARVLSATWFAHMSAYRAEIVIWMISGSLPLIMMAAWIGKAQANGGSVDGYTPQGFAAYFLAAWITQQWLVAWVAWELDRLIRLGELSPKLLRPLDPLWEQFAAHVTERFVRLPFMVIIRWSACSWCRAHASPPICRMVPSYLICVNLAFFTRFLIAYCRGLLAFWITQATALDELYFVVASFLTGSFAPLSLYPAAMQSVIQWLPFPYLVYYPVQVLNGTLATGIFRAC